MRIVLKGLGYRSKLIEKGLTCRKAPDPVILAARRAGVGGKTYLEILENLGVYSLNLERHVPKSRDLSVYASCHIKGGWHGISGITYLRAMNSLTMKLTRLYGEKKESFNSTPRRKGSTKGDRSWKIIP